MRDLRTKIAALALALGLGGLGGFAIGANKTSHRAAAASTEGTKVVRRTVHAKPHRVKVKAAHPRHSPAEHAVASHPVSTGSSGSGSSESSSGSPVRTGSSGSSGGGSSHPPVSTGSSGGGGGTVGGGGGDDGGEAEHEGGD